ncbi:MAG: hypothetical protein IPP77_10945 [Bacteroidetes bacterium]|nr:hypothetical protein [Bacteroidota bacterium]
MESTEKISKWKIFGEIISIRTTAPSGNPEFWLYFVLINLVFCALGIYVSIFTDLVDKNRYFDFRALNTNLGTFYIAILASGCFDLILSRAKIMKTTLSMFSIAILVFGILALIISAVVRLRFALPITFTFCIVSLFIWWIANAENDKLMMDEVSISDITGGNLAQKILGDLGDFKTK